MAKMMSPNTTLWWVTDPAFDPDNPSAALLTTAANISCAVVTGYAVNPADSDTDNTASICDDSNVENLTAYNYTGSVTFFREGDSANSTSDFAKAWTFFKHKTGQAGYIVRRLGKLSNVAAAAGDVVSSFKFIADNPQDVVAENAPIQFKIDFLPQGKMSLYKTAVA